MRSRRLGLVTLAAVAALLTGCAGGPAAAPASGGATTPIESATPVPTPSSLGTTTIGLTYIPNVQFSPFYVATAGGSYAQAGVDVQLRHHGANEGLFTALVAGTEQFVVAGADEMVQARAQGMDLISIATLYRQYPVVIIVKADSPVRSVADLKGRSVGLPGKYGESWFGLLAALKGAGLTGADVKVTEIGYTQQAALTTGKVDAVVGFSNNDAVQFERAGVAIRQLPLVASGPVPLIGISLITTKAYADAHPDITRAVVSGTITGMNAVAADQERALVVSKAQIPGLDEKAAMDSARATLAATVPVWREGSGGITGVQSPQQWQAMVTFMRAQGLIATDVDAGACFTNEYLG